MRLLRLLLSRDKFVNFFTDAAIMVLEYWVLRTDSTLDDNLVHLVKTHLGRGRP